MTVCVVLKNKNMIVTHYNANLSLNFNYFTWVFQFHATLYCDSITELFFYPLHLFDNISY